MRLSRRAATALLAVTVLMGGSGGCAFFGSNTDEIVETITVTAKTVRQTADTLCAAGKAVLGPIEALGVGDHALVQGGKKACLVWDNLPKPISSRGANDPCDQRAVVNTNNDPELAAFMARQRSLCHGAPQ